MVFKDITPLLGDPSVFGAVIAALADGRRGEVDLVAGVEARGFVVGAALAHAMGVGFVPVRKAGKLPGDTVAASYDLEYGSATIEVHADAVGAGRRVVLVDDVLATGGTALAAWDLLERVGGARRRLRLHRRARVPRGPRAARGAGRPVAARRLLRRD